jgi:protein tyrosine/serine phosphatase
VSLNRLYNFHWIIREEAARSSQSYLGAFGTFLKANRLKSVINLRGAHPDVAWWRYETETCARLGVAHFDAMMDSRRLPLRPMLAGLFDAFDAAPKPFVIKCSGGQDRTSFAAALYIIHLCGWSAIDTAHKQFSRFPFLHFPREHQRWLRQFLVFAKEQSNGTPLADWVRRDYDPHMLAQWLDTNGFAGSYNGIWEPWKPRAPR